MEYQETLQKNLDAYETLKAQYTDLTKTDTFDFIRTTMPFRFLKARYILDTLALFQDGESTITFKTGEEAARQYLDIVGFKHEKEELLNHASYLEEVIHVKDELNALVKDNPYLSDSLSLPGFGRLETIVKDCLKEVPKYKELMTKAFRINFIQSCIKVLNETDLNLLLEKNIIMAKDLDVVNQTAYTNDATYQHNLTYLRGVTGTTPAAEPKKESAKVYHTKIKGTTYANEDGTSRQDILKEIAEQVKAGANVKLTAVMSEFTKEDGEKEPYVPVSYGDKIVGSLSREKAFEVSGEFTNPAFTIRNFEILGGGSVNYGCSIEVEVAERAKEIELE